MLPNDYAGHYHSLYLFQDRLLNIIFSFDNMFYLTGGTALARFHQYNHRYSDDLDFFTHRNNWFKFEFKDFSNRVQSAGFDFEICVESRDFIRTICKNEMIALQIDFVNDYVNRSENPERIAGYRIDTENEILSNKLGAIFNRDEPKDIADILEAYQRGYRKWRLALEMAQAKQTFALEDLIVRLQTFPRHLLTTIKYANPLTRDIHMRCCANHLSAIIHAMVS